VTCDGRLVAGELAAVKIFALDEFLNYAITGGERFQFWLIQADPVSRNNMTVIDRTDGTYAVSYTITRAGMYRVEIWRAQLHIDGSPFIVEVLESRTSVAKTVIYGAGIRGGALNSISRFAVVLKDIYGNERKSGGDSVQAVPLDLLVVSSAVVTDGSDGTFTVTYRGLSVGSFRMRVVVNNVTVPGSPFRGLISLVPGTPSAAFTAVQAPLPIRAVASRESPVLLEVMDANGAQVSTAVAAEAVSFSIDAPLGYRIDEPRMETSANNLGVFTFVLPSTTRAGTYLLHIFIDTAEIKNSPFNVTVEAAEIDTSSCGIRPMTLGGEYTTVTAGVAGLFLIDIRDVYSNIVVYDPRIDIGLRADISGAVNDSIRLIEHYMEGNPGLVEGVYILTQSGVYTIQVTIAAAPVSGSPFDIVVVPAPLEAESCYARGPGLATAVPGASAVFDLQAFDTYGNVADTKGANLGAVLEIATAVTDAVFVMPMVAAVRYLDGGQYSGQYIVTRSAEYTLSLTFGGVHVQQSPFHVSVQPLDVEARNVDLTGLGLRKAQVGEIASFDIATRDRFGNLITRGGTVFNLSLANKQTVLNPSIYDRDDGSYQGFYVPRLPDLYNLTILLRSVHLKGSPFTVEVSLSLPPICVEATFVSGGSVIRLVFDLPTDRGGQVGRLSCSVYFDNATVALLGNGCEAGWRSSFELLVSLGAGAVVMVGDDLSLRSGLVRNKRRTSYFTFGVIRLGFNPDEMQPFVSINGPSELGDCDDLSLNAQQTNSSGGRPLKFRWGVAQGDSVEEAIMAYLVSLGPISPVIIVNSSLLLAGRTYTFSVEAVNFVGSIGRATFAVAVRAEPLPLVYVEGPQVRLISPRRPLWLRANASRSVCEPARQLAFQWTIVAASDGVTPSIGNATGRRLYIARDTLAPGVEYVVQLRCYMEGDTERGATARVVLRATEPPLTFDISGGSRSVSFRDEVALAARFPETSSPDAFRSHLWGCLPAPCFPGADALAINSSGTVMLRSSLLRPGAYLISLQASAQIGPSRQAGARAVRLYVTPGSPALVTVLGPDNAVVNPAAEHLLTGLPARYLHLDWVYQWHQLAGEDALTGSSSVLGVSTDLFGFVAGVLTAGQAYRFRLEVGAGSGVGFAELDLMAAAAPGGGRLTVAPLIGFAPDTVFRLSAGGWVDDPDNLPLRYVFAYVVGVSATQNGSVPLGVLDDLELDVRLPRLDSAAVRVTFLLTVQNQADCEVQRSVTATVYPPTDPAASAEALQALLDEARYTADLETALACANALSSLLGASGTALRRAAGGAAPCSNDGGSCDNDGLRLRALAAIRSALNGVVPRAMEAGMFASAIQAASSMHINRTTQLVVIDAVQALIQGAITDPRGDGVTMQAGQRLVDTSSMLLQASNDTRAGADALNHSEHVSAQVAFAVANLANYIVENMYAGQIQREVAAEGLQLLAVRIPRGFPGAQQVNLSGSATLGIQMQPSELLGSAEVASLDAVMVQWATDVHPRGGATLGSSVATVNLTMAGEGEARVHLSDLDSPVLLTFAKGPVRGDTSGATINECRFWDGGAGRYYRAGAIVMEDAGGLVTCEVYHLTDFASLVSQALGDADLLAAFGEPNPFERWTPDRVLAFAVCVVLLAAYLAGCAYARRLDRRAVAELAAGIRHRDEPKGGGTVVRSEEEVQRSRDYVMIKAILKQRLANRYRSWRVQTLELLRTEHVLGGVIWRPVFSSFTRPRRLTCLFVIFLGNLALNVLLLGRGGFDPSARIAAGIVAAIVVFPVGLFFVAAFRAVDSETTWRMHRRRRVRRVQESVAIKAALDMVDAPPVPPPQVAPKPPPAPPRAGPSPPSSERPAFTRRAASRSTAASGSSLSVGGALPAAGGGRPQQRPLGWPALALPPAPAEVESTLYRPSNAAATAAGRGDRPAGGVSGLRTFSSRNEAVRAAVTSAPAQQATIEYRPQGAPPPAGGGPSRPAIGFSTYGSGATPPPPPPPGENPRPLFGGRGRGARPAGRIPPPPPPGVNRRPAAPPFVTSARGPAAGGPPAPPQGRNLRPRVPGRFQPIRMGASLAPGGGALYSAPEDSGPPLPPPPIAPPPEGRSSRPRVPNRGPPRPPGAYLPRRLFGFNPAAAVDAVASTGGGDGSEAAPTLPSAFERRQMLVDPFAAAAGQSARARAAAAGGGGRLSTIAEADEDEQRAEGPTLPTRAKPARHIAESRLRWLRERLLSREDRRRNELLLLLPPPAAYGVYAVAGLWMLACFYLILLHGLRFSPELEAAWVIASVVAALQELLVQQVVGLALSAAFRQLFVPAVTRNIVPVREGAPPAATSEIDPAHPVARLRRVPRPPAAAAGDK
jgi:hypothetical protein